MSLRNDIVSFWFWGYWGDIRIELQASVDRLVILYTCTLHWKSSMLYQYFQEWEDNMFLKINCFKNMCQYFFAVTTTRTVQNIKPVKNAHEPEHLLAACILYEC